MSNQQQQSVEKVCEEVPEMRNELLRQSTRIRHLENFLITDVKELKMNETNQFCEMEIFKLNKNLTQNLEFLEDKFSGRIGNIISEISRIIDEEITPLSEKIKKISNSKAYGEDVVG